MKLINRHIKKFEQFIQNSKDPNEEEKKELKKKKLSEPVPEDPEETDPEEENILDEIKEYFSKKNFKY